MAADDDGAAVRAALPQRIALVDSQALMRQCVVRSLEAICPSSVIEQYASSEEWLASTKSAEPAHVVIYNISESIASASSTKEHLRGFIAAAEPSKVIVLSRSDDVSCVLDAIECGAVSYISLGSNLDELLEALRIAASGSIFVQRKSLLALRSLVKPQTDGRPRLDNFFTERQLAVARALRRGLANKTIAYELNLCESTVKVHIRNIMRKLKATNRTQAAFKLNAFSDTENDSE
ncbi:LuxR C-terminal-related transcriptional regulator [Acuticoccus sediminis]|nr:response regulator transcription factor [Acuticoccus sediminis]